MKNNQTIRIEISPVHKRERPQILFLHFNLLDLTPLTIGSFPRSILFKGADLDEVGLAFLQLRYIKLCLGEGLIFLYLGQFLLGKRTGYFVAVCLRALHLDGDRACFFALCRFDHCFIRS